MTVCNSIVLNTLHDFRDKGDNMLITCFYLKTKEIDFNSLQSTLEHTLMSVYLYAFVSHNTLKNNKACVIEQ